MGYILAFLLGVVVTIAAPYLWPLVESGLAALGAKIRKQPPTRTP